MIRLKQLEIQGFRKFKDLVTIDFPESGLLLLDGESGAGKSTVMQAIAYALDICPFPATTLKSWSGESMQVNLTVVSDGKDVKICRGKRAAIEIDGEVKTGAKALEEGLRALFGMPSDLLSALTYRPQDTLGLFLSKDDAEKKEFLAKLLGLNSVEAAIDDADERRKKLQAELTFAQGSLVEREAGLRKILEQQTEISPDPFDTGFIERLAATAEVLKTLDAEVAAAEAEVKRAHGVFVLESDNERHAKTERLEYAKSLYKALKDKNAQNNAELEQRRNQIRSRLVSLGLELSAFDRLRQDKKAAESRLESLKQNKCYVCHQTFTAELEIDNLCEEIDFIANRLSGEPVLRLRWESDSQELKSLVPYIDPNEAKLAKAVADLEAEVKWIGKNITDTRVIAAQKEESIKTGRYVDAKQDFVDAQRALHEHQAAIEVKERMRTRQETARNQAIEAVDIKRTEVARIEEALNAEKDFLHVLGKDGFLGAIFDDVLAEIGKEANETLGSIPNTSHISVQFRTETNKGKKAIVPVFLVDGFETTRQSGLSGGMGASADLAVDLGVAEVVERRLGKAPGWLCLDETFNGMPRATKEAAIEALQNFVARSDKLVIVIDHGTELKSSFHKVLTVKNEGGRSFV